MNYRLNRNINLEGENGLSKLDEYVDKLCSVSDPLNNVIQNYRNITIKEFFAKTKIGCKRGYQPCNDMNEIMFKYIKNLLGQETALETIDTITTNKIVLTANHHGVDYFAQSAQGTLLFSFMSKENYFKKKIIPVIACGNVSLNNLTYPRGILIYNLKERNKIDAPLRIPIFPDREKTKTVCAVEGIKLEYLKNTIKRVSSLKNEKVISNKMYNILISIIEQDYMSAHVLAQKRYSEQSVILNNLLWRKIFKGDLCGYKVVYLELEEIANKLIQKDLVNTSSLIYILLFDPIIRNNIIYKLDKKKACWENDALNNKYQNFKIDRNEALRNKNCGTHFFWGIDRNHKRIPLLISGDHNSNISLTGLGEDNVLIKIPFKPDILCEKLEKKEIIPSLFLSYSAISFARGIVCVGGYYQSEYLPIMKEKLLESLGCQISYRDIYRAINQIEAKNYLSGMQTIMIKNDDLSAVPAGPIELIESNGINEQDIKKILKINVLDAHKASLLDTLTDLKIQYNDGEEWKKIVSMENYIELKDNVIMREDL
jgi:hypothetical protein